MKEEKLKFYNGVKCLSHLHKCKLMYYVDKVYEDSHNPPVFNWSNLSAILLKQRKDRSAMYASLAEPTIKISELMVSCPERFVVSPPEMGEDEILGIPIGGWSVIKRYFIKDGGLTLSIKGDILVGELFNQHELTFLLPFVKTLVDNHLQKEFNASLVLEKEALLKEEEERLLKRKALSEQYRDI